MAADLRFGLSTSPKITVLFPIAPTGLSGIVVSRVAGPVALARVDAERTDVKSSRIPEGGYVTGPDGRFLLPLDAGLWTVGALAYGTWHRRPAVPVAEGLVTDLVIRVP